MRQATLFAGFTAPCETLEGDVQIITRGRNLKPSLRKLRLSEKQVTAGVVEFLQLRKWWAIRTPVGRMAFEYGGDWIGEEGRPDWLFVNPGFWPSFFWCEMKETSEKPTPIQCAHMEVLRRDGHLVTWTDDPDEFKRWYERMLRDGILMPREVPMF